MLQTIPAVFRSPFVHGNTRNVSGTGWARMSLSSIVAYPTTLEPSKTTPSLRARSSFEVGIVTAFTNPKSSMNMIWTNCTFSFFAVSRTCVLGSSSAIPFLPGLARPIEDRSIKVPDERSCPKSGDKRRVGMDGEGGNKSGDGEAAAHAGVRYLCASTVRSPLAVLAQGCFERDACGRSCPSD